jgi:hypothetical protein
VIEGLLYLALAILVMVAVGAVVRRVKRIVAPVAARRTHRRNQAAAAQVLERYLRDGTTLETAAVELVEHYGQSARSAMWLGVVEIRPGKATIPTLMPPEFSSDDPRVRQVVNRVAELLRSRAAGSLSSPVRSRVAREFSPSDRDEIELFLMQYTNDNPEPERVHSAILVLGQGRRNEVAYNVWVAMQDYRDVLYSANHDKFKES